MPMVDRGVNATPAVCTGRPVLYLSL
ncbi:hypothetical protein A2U01_0101593, partial [Trifolium medium]|nr:hypothetical protein [Trifolium medium]